MLQRIRRSFRKKKASYCINCGHVSRECYHQEYENVDFSETQQASAAKADDLKWLDLDYRFTVLQHNAVNRVQRQLMEDAPRSARPRSLVYSNDYVELPTYSIPYDQVPLMMKYSGGPVLRFFDGKMAFCLLKILPVHAKLEHDIGV
jgi:hypothetical protein